MVTLRFFKRGFGLGDCLLAPLAFLLSRGLFLPALAIASLPFSLERKGGLACCFVVNLLSRRFACRRSFTLSMGSSFGSSACSLNAPSDPTGRRRTTPGLASVAATIAGSSVSFAKPCWKRFVSEPQACKAAFIDGAAMARSKNPREV
jgi:hypothetical protein